MKLLVYSAVFGGYDSVKCPAFPEEDVTWHLFTDKDVPEDSAWDFVSILDPTDNPRRDARLIKTSMPTMLQSAGFDATLWIDGSMTPKVPVHGLVDKWLEHRNFAAFVHPERDCVYDETRHITKLGKDSEARMTAARRCLAQDDFPMSYGLAATGILARWQCEAVKEHAGLWRAAVDEVSLRDQVSFGWIAHKVTEAKAFTDWLEPIPGNVFNNKLFSRAKHRL